MILANFNDVTEDMYYSDHTRDDWSFPTSLLGWNRQRPSNIHVTTSHSRFYTILSSNFTNLQIILCLNSPSLTLRRLFKLCWLLSVLVK